MLVSGEGENDLALQKFDADQIFDQIDKDGRGKINIDQFRVRLFDYNRNSFKPYRLLEIGFDRTFTSMFCMALHSVKSCPRSEICQ